MSFPKTLGTGLGPRHPVHVTLRAAGGIPSLRGADIFAAVRRGLESASVATFRVVHFSAQVNHLHLLVEADGTDPLRRGMQGLAIRVAKAINRVLARRGRVWEDRYHSRALATPREVRNALVYVLLNGRKHGVTGRGIDPCSSGAWFVGWKEAIVPPPGPAPVKRPRTWLLRVGWRRSAAIGLDNCPAWRVLRKRARSAKRGTAWLQQRGTRHEVLLASGPPEGNVC